MSWFTQKSLQDAEDIYNKIQYKEDQRAIVVALSKVASSLIPMNEIPMRGFMAGAIRNWQVENNQTLEDILKAPPTGKAKAVKEILGLLGNNLTRVLINPADKNKVKDGMSAVFKTYVDSYSKR
jgi:hypothetical protein